MTAFSTGFLEPFCTGSGTAGAAGIASPVSLGGVAYETNAMEPGSQSRYEFSHASVPQQRVALDDRDNASRATLNPEAFWRRTFESWHVGAGQSQFDRAEESNPFRFRRSRGVDVLTNRYQLSLLPATDSKRTSANTNLFLAVAGTYLYATDGTALLYTQDITVDTPTWTTVTGGSAVAFSSIASDGFNVLVAAGASGIDKTTRGAATKTNHITGTVDIVGHGKGRWVAATGPALYDITTTVPAGGALPPVLFTHPNTDWDWTCFAEGPSALYAAGTSGDKSLIYRLTMKEDGTGLNQPVVAGFLPDGETVHSMQGYLGFVLIGTSKGLRVGIVGGNGDLTIGAFIPTDAPVRCFEGQDRFVWFGWTNHEDTSSGLGRVDLQTFSNADALAPAYASDLMATGTVDATVSVVTFQDRRVFTVSASGVWAEDADLVDSGTLDTGTFDFGLTDEKLSLYVDSDAREADGGVTFHLSVDGGSFGSLGDPGDTNIPLATGEARGHDFELRIELTRDGLDATLGPVVTMWALRAQPVSPVTEQIVVPLRIAPTLTRADGVIENVDSFGQYEHVVSLCRTKEVVQYTLGSRAWSVVVSDYQLDVHDVWIGADSALGMKGTCLVQMRTVIS